LPPCGVIATPSAAQIDTTAATSAADFGRASSGVVPCQRPRHSTSLDHDRHYVLVDYAAEWLSGEPRAGDDASEAMFVPIERACDMVAWDETRRIILLAAALRAGVV
jgi:hypothetical protein